MKDRFSAHANQYAQFRPFYPPELYEFIYRHVGHFGSVWDCGTGNGQAARDLSKKFSKVFATDISSKQLGNAFLSDTIFYSIANEKSSFADNSFDLITVAQAAHWFDMEAFSKEARRVAKANSLIALWGYSLLTINPKTDRLLNQFYTQVVGAYWDKERRHVDEHYKNLYFPFEEIQSPSFTISLSWTLTELIGYLSTWSAVQKYILVNKQNPIENLIEELETFWKEDMQVVRFPLFLRLGRITKKGNQK